MKNHFPSIAKLVAVAACALTLGSCNRAEYAMLPKGASYHGVARAATPVPAAPVAIVTLPSTIPAEVMAPEAVVAEAAPASAKAAAVPVTPVAEAQAKNAAAAVVVAAASSRNVATTNAKPTLMQRIVANKVTKKVDKLTQKFQQNSRLNTASTSKTSALNSNLKLGIILLVVGALVTLLPGGIFDLIGAIIAIIGLLFILLAILDMV